MGFMNKDDVIQILKIVAESNLAELHLESGDLKLILKRHAKGSTEAEGAPPRPVTAMTPLKSPQEPRDQGIGRTAVIPAEVSVQSKRTVALQEEEGFVAIRAPMLGTFYRAPKPDAPPFVEEGQFVTEDDAVCIIEVMKLFNTVKAGVRGRVAKICAENAHLVEYNQVLFLVEETAEKDSGEERAS